MPRIRRYFTDDLLLPVHSVDLETQVGLALPALAASLVSPLDLAPTFGTGGSFRSLKNRAADDAKHRLLDPQYLPLAARYMKYLRLKTSSKVDGSAGLHVMPTMIFSTSLHPARHTRLVGNGHQSPAARNLARH